MKGSDKFLKSLSKDINRVNSQSCCSVDENVRFNSKTGLLEYITGETWSPVPLSNFWKLDGNFINTSNFIGSTNNLPVVFKSGNINSGIIGYAGSNFVIATGSGGVAFGQYALDTLTTNDPTGDLGLNTAFGVGAGRWIGYTGTNEDQPGESRAKENTLIGWSAGHYIQKRNSETHLSRNVAVGESALYRALAPSDNVAIGNFAMESGLKPRGNTAVGRDSLRSIIDGYGNVAIGSLSQAYASTGIKSVTITNGGTGYTTATVVISAPLFWGTPGTAYAQATATAVISGGSIVAINIVDPGAGYTSKGGIYPNGTLWSAGAIVTITGDGTGATAIINPAVDMISNQSNTSLGSSAGIFRRFGTGNLDLGYNAGAVPRYYDDYNIMIGTGTGVDSSVPIGTPLTNAIAIGYNAKVSTSNTMVLGGTGIHALSIAVGAITANSSSILDLTSTTKGFLPPRMTAMQVEAIIFPAEGLMVYATDGTGVVVTSKGWWGYNGATWEKLNP